MTLDPVFDRVLSLEREARHTTAGQFAQEFVSALAQAGLSPISSQLPLPTPIQPHVPIPSGSVPVTPVPSASMSKRSYAVGGAILVGAIAIAAFMYGDTNRPDGVDSSKSYAPTDGRTESKASIDTGKADTAMRSASGGNARDVDDAVRRKADAKPKPLGHERAVSVFDVDDWPELKSVADARRRIQDVNAVLPTLRIVEDSIGAETLLLEAFQILGDTDAICRLLPSIDRRSVGTEYAPAVAVWKRNVPCRDGDNPL